MIFKNINFITSVKNRCILYRLQTPLPCVPQIRPLTQVPTQVKPGLKTLNQPGLKATQWSMGKDKITSTITQLDNPP